MLTADFSKGWLSVAHPRWGATTLDVQVRPGMAPLVCRCLGARTRAGLHSALALRTQGRGEPPVLVSDQFWRAMPYGMSEPDDNGDVTVFHREYRPIARVSVSGVPTPLANARVGGSPEHYLYQDGERRLHDVRRVLAALAVALDTLGVVEDCALNDPQLSRGTGAAMTAARAWVLRHGIPHLGSRRLQKGNW